MGICLCPRCLAKKQLASKLGTSHDTHTRVSKRRIESNKRIKRVQEARHLIYELGHPIQSTQVEALLQADSYVPTLNAFSHRLSPKVFKFNIFETFVVDLLHEIELGVWKSLLQHLIRLLHVGGNQAVIEFNRRFRAVPSFGSTIRMFSEDVAGMGRLAARDFEDILQWHGLAKLRRHTAETLKIMKKLTTELGVALRDFAEKSRELDVRETPDEYTRRKRRQATTQTSATSNFDRNKKLPNVEVATDGRRPAFFNLNTYKVHAIGDYVSTIMEFGTTDSYSTQICELQHRRIKDQFDRTNKKGVVEQMTHIGDIASVLKDMDNELREQETRVPAQSGDFGSVPVDSEGVESLMSGSAYTVGQTERSEDKIMSIKLWAYEQRHDDAMRFFMPQLRGYLLARFLGSRSHSKFNEGELSKVRFHRDRLYCHKTLRVNYTSYDVLRQQDLLNPSTSNRFIMLPAESDNESNSPHPFLYAKILGIYHAHVSYDQMAPRREDFVHVRWLYYDTRQERKGGWNEYRLDHLSYEQCRTEQDILDSFDFIHPSDIIRAIHLIPDFQSGISYNLLNSTQSIAHDSGEHWDWSYYYVNRFVDRDILMRYLGGGIGHYHHRANTTQDAEDTTARGYVEQVDDQANKHSEDELLTEANEADQVVSDNVSDCDDPIHQQFNTGDDEEGWRENEEGTNEIEEDEYSEEDDSIEVGDETGEYDDFDDLYGY